MEQQGRNLAEASWRRRPLCIYGGPLFKIVHLMRILCYFCMQDIEYFNFSSLQALN